MFKVSTQVSVVNVEVINAIKELKAENASLKRDIEKIKAVLGITDKTGI